MKVCLDPGHVKGYNVGYNRSYAEGTAMFDYAYVLKGKLEQHGIQVVVTRAKVTDNPSLSSRGSKAKGCDLFVSLHSNGVDNPAAYGVSTFYSIKRDNDKKDAQDWCDLLAKLIGTRSRGATTRKGGGDWDYYTVIQSAVAAKCPHVFLIEHGFHSNPDECAWLMKSSNISKMAELECEIICDILGVPKSGASDLVPDNGMVAYPTGKIVNTPNDTLNVRAEANYKAKKLNELADKSAVSVTGLASNGWAHIKQGNITGWVNGAYLTSLECSTDIRVTKTPGDTLNLRAAPVYTAQRLGEIPHNTRVFAWRTEKNGWVLVCYNSIMGWVNGDYLREAGK